MEQIVAEIRKQLDDESFIVKAFFVLAVLSRTVLHFRSQAQD